MIADARPAFGSSVAEELEGRKIRSALGLLRAHLKFRTCHLVLIISGNAEQVVVGYPVTFLNFFGCVTEALIVLDDLAVFRNVCERDLVAVGDVFLSDEREDLISLSVGDFGSLGDVSYTCDDVIG